MNKIIVEESKESIKLENNSSYYINKCNNDMIFNINKESNLIVNIFNTDDINLKYVFNILNDSNVEINIFDSSKNIQRDINININGENSSVKLNLSVISIDQNNYTVNIYHNNKKTHSEANLHGLTINNSKIFIKNNGYIKKGSSKSSLNQDNKIIIMNYNNSKIEPNLYIDEYDASASHGAYIGKFDEEQLFYLNSRGIDDKDSYSLLIEGFLIGDMNITNDDKEVLKNMINKYWR